MRATGQGAPSRCVATAKPTGGAGRPVGQGRHGRAPSEGMVGHHCSADAPRLRQAAEHGRTGLPAANAQDTSRRSAGCRVRSVGVCAACRGADALPKPPTHAFRPVCNPHLISGRLGVDPPVVPAADSDNLDACPTFPPGNHKVFLNPTRNIPCWRAYFCRPNPST